jgi:crotonobetainyl-CoA:carnitine CoA-transferase CaiB-like acyl-CoA transferase
VPILPVEMDGRRFSTRIDVPQIGAHTREILGQLGYDDRAIDQLIAERAVAT